MPGAVELLAIAGEKRDRAIRARRLAVNLMPRDKERLIQYASEQDAEAYEIERQAREQSLCDGAHG